MPNEGISACTASISPTMTWPRLSERNVVWPGSCVLALDLHPRGGTVHRRVRVLEPRGGAPRLLDPNYLAQLAKRIEPNTAASPIQRGTHAEPPLEASPTVQRVQERLLEPLPPHERMTFVRLLDQLVDLHGGLLPRAGAT
jgi:hypothetical protein